MLCNTDLVYPLILTISGLTWSLRVLDSMGLVVSILVHSNTKLQPHMFCACVNCLIVPVLVSVASHFTDSLLVIEF